MAFLKSPTNWAPILSLKGPQQYNGSRLQISANLIDAESEAHIWADDLDVPLEDLLKTNNVISVNVAESVGNTVIETEVARMTKDDVSALMIANAAQSRIMRDFSRESLLKNIEEQERSLQEYPDSAWGHLGQALSLRIGLRYGWIEGDEAQIRKRMYDLARRGVELDPNNFMAYQALGRALTMNNDPIAAANAFRRAIELNPSSSFARTSLAQTLGFIGETQEALEVIAEAELVDPYYGHDVHWEKARLQWQTGDCDQALETFQASPSMPTAAKNMLAAIHHCLGNAGKGGTGHGRLYQGKPRLDRGPRTRRQRRPLDCARRSRPVAHGEERLRDAFLTPLKLSPRVPHCENERVYTIG